MYNHVYRKVFESNQLPSSVMTHTYRTVHLYLMMLDDTDGNAEKRTDALILKLLNICLDWNTVRHSSILTKRASRFKGILYEEAYVRLHLLDVILLYCDGIGYNIRDIGTETLEALTNILLNTAIAGIRPSIDSIWSITHGADGRYYLNYCHTIQYYELDRIMEDGCYTPVKEDELTDVINEDLYRTNTPEH